MRVQAKNVVALRTGCGLGSLLVFFAAVTCGFAMEFSVSEHDMGPMGNSYSIEAVGEIVDGDADELASLIKGLSFRERRDLHILFDSPGGNLYEGLRIGKLLRALRHTDHVVTTNVGRSSGAGSCSSACVLAYVGGHYRFLRDGSLLGVHRFSVSSDMNLTAAQALADAQIVAADIIDFLGAMGVDVGLFRLMSDVPAREIAFLPLPVLRETRLVTLEVAEEDEELVYRDGVFYAALRQQSYWGYNVLATHCNDQREPVFLAFLQPGAGLPINMFDTPQVALDDRDLTLAGMDIIPSTNTVQLIFKLARQDLDHLLNGGNLSVRLTNPDSGLFFGTTFQGRAEKTRNFIAGCLGQGRPTSIGAIATQNIETYSALDFYGNDLLKNGARPVSWDECTTLCRSERSCVAVSYVPQKNWCWLKSRVSNLTRRTTVVSGIVRSH